MGLALIVHGGAGAMARERYDAAREGCREAAVAGWRVLRAGGSALDAVEKAISVLENNPGFNAGTGGVLTTDGRAQLDAGIMDGETLDAGAIAGVERIKNPIQVARRVLASPHVLLIGAGAESFATDSGIALCDPSELVTPAQYARWQRGYGLGDDVNVGDRVDVGAGLGAIDMEAEPGTRNGAYADDEPVHADAHKHGTVGAVAVDARGVVAAGASTGGIAAKHPGRVGDTPIVGAGFYAENGLGGVSSTGHGEDFIRLLLARRALDYIAAGSSAQAAATKAMQLLSRRVGGSGGLILLDGQGRVGYARNSPTMAHAFIVEGMDVPFAGV
ncbi:MAG: isoaspartyl aminopeptidase [Ktedonobacterales bacterium]|jgi:beta-aspartyl-peptidase (threonine type)|nr:MAG: isoaspartyl aminopeptidase [Ktedonobacterales bacterium]